MRIWFSSKPNKSWILQAGKLFIYYHLFNFRRLRNTRYISNPLRCT